MPKKTILLLFILCSSFLAKAQTADEVYDKYLDFNAKRLEDNDITDALKAGEAILPNVGKLPPKSRIAFYNGLAKLYEDNSQSVEAIPLYEMVAAAEPNFYVVHRALGYLYVKAANELLEKTNKVTDQYKAAVLKALPHLEKAQACDPSDETLTLIKSLYTNIHDDAGLNSLSSRLKALSQNCIDILTE
jgi:tetratricopeptide (TPR) repeat protein